MKIKTYNEMGPLRISKLKPIQNSFSIEIRIQDRDISPLHRLEIYASQHKAEPNKFSAEYLFTTKDFKIDVNVKDARRRFPGKFYYFSIFSTETVVLHVWSKFGNEDV